MVESPFLANLAAMRRIVCISAHQTNKKKAP
jgi:hypothetical protein